MLFYWGSIIRLYYSSFFELFLNFAIFTLIDFLGIFILSCGDDGRIRGWKWKDCVEAEAPIHLQGDLDFWQLTIPCELEQLVH